jgi:hypothetical protein
LNNDINLFGEKPSVPEKELATAKQELAETVGLLEKVKSIPSAEAIAITKTTALKVLERANAMAVIDQATFDEATSLAGMCTKAMKSIKENPMLQEGRETAHKLWKWHTNLLAMMIGPYEESRVVLDKKSQAWERAERQRREAEAARIRAENQRKLDDEKLALAAKLDEEGDSKTAERILDTPTEAPPVAAEKIQSGAPGRVVQQNWKAEVVDLMALVQAVAAGTMPLIYLEANMTALNQAAKAMKGACNIPGVKAYDAGKILYRGQ